MLSYIRCVLFLALAILFFGSVPSSLSAQPQLGGSTAFSGNAVKRHTHADDWFVSPDNQDHFCATPSSPGSADDRSSGPSCGEAGESVASYWISMPGRYEARNGIEGDRCYLEVTHPDSLPDFYLQPLLRRALTEEDGDYPLSDTIPENWWDQNATNILDFLWVKAIERNGLISAFFQLSNPWHYHLSRFSSIGGPTEYHYHRKFNSEHAASQVEFEFKHHQSTLGQASSMGSVWNSQFRTTPHTKRIANVEWFDTALRMKDGVKITMRPGQANSSTSYYRYAAIALDPRDPSVLDLGAIGWTWALLDISFGGNVVFQTPTETENSFDVKYETQDDGYLYYTRENQLKITVESEAECLVGAQLYSSYLWPHDIAVRKGVLKPSGADIPEVAGISPDMMAYNQPLVLPRHGLTDAPDNVLVSTIWNGCESTCFLIDLEGFLYDPDAVTPQRDMY